MVTGDEFAKLKQAQDNANVVVTTETIAMQSMRGEFDDGGASQVAAASRSLAEGTAEQVASIEDIAASGKKKVDDVAAAIRARTS